MLNRTTRVAASSRTLAMPRTRTRTSVTARDVVHTLVASLAPLSFVFALLFSLAARAEQSDVQRLEEKITATGATKIYLNGSTIVGTNSIPDGAEFDNLVFVYTNAAVTGALTLDSTVRANARILLVGGGGAGGSGGGTGLSHGGGGGGGAGGYLEIPSATLLGGNYSIIVGTGGVAKAAMSIQAGGNGGRSLIATNGVPLIVGSTTLEAFGGGGGGAESDGAGYDADGGIYLASGGGGSREYSGENINHVGGAGMSGQGNKGGDSKLWRAGGGGGGAGTEGAASATANYGGNGGDGLPSDITGEELYYAGGGGGGTGNQSNETRLGQPGKGGGGRGAGNASFNPLPGDDGFGGGGGGGSLTVAGANGGCGTVIVRITQLVETKVSYPTIADKIYNKENQVALDLGIKYTYTGGTLNATNADEYVLFIKPGPELTWMDGGTYETNVQWKIVKRLIEKPTVTNFVYDATDKVGVTYASELPKYCTFDASNVTNATNAGTYPFSVSLKEPENTAWDDNSIDPVEDSWTIAPAKVTRPTPVTSFEYDGKEKTALEIAATDQYELTDGVLRATNGGSYPFTIELKGNTAATNYVWDSDPATSDPFEGTWEITPAVNAITSLSLVGWRIGTKANKPKIKAAWGDDKAEYSYGFGDDPASITGWTTDTDDLTEAGTWILRAVIPATGNWTAATGTTTFVMWNDPGTLFRNWTDITIKGTTTSLTNFVVPVRISEARMRGFYYSDADSAKLVFIDNLGNLLPYDVDTWGESGESVVWLKLPTLPTEGITVTMYWNLRDGQIAPANEPTDVWSDYAGVWHMTDTSDSAAGASHGTLGNKTTAVGGIFGGALSANQQGEPLILATASEAVNSVTGDAFTVSFYTKYNSTGTGTSVQYLFSRRPVYDQAGYAGLINDNRRVVSSTANTFRILYGKTWTDGGNMNADKFGMPTETWIRNDVYFRGAASGGRFEWWINGVYIDGASWNNSLANNGTTGLLGIGGLAAAGSDSNINGAMDEFRIRSGRADANLIAAEYKYQSDLTMVTNGVVYLDGDKLDYWIVEPSLKYPDMLSWDVDPEKNVDAAGNIRTNEIATIGQLCYGTVTNYIYSLYDQNETYDSLSALTNAGNYRVVFTQADTNGYKRIEKIFDIKVTKSKPYGDIVGNGGDSGRILLMNNHIGEEGHPDVDYQGWYDADNAGAKKSDTPTYWHHENLDVPTETGYNLKNGTESMLYAVDRRRLWHLVNCRHGNTFPTKTATTLTPNQNYLPYTPEYSKTITGHRANQAATTRSTVGQLVMQNLGDEDPYKAEDKCAVVYSSCFTNGIGTIYFDAVNGWRRDTENYENYKIVVEIATSTVDGDVPRDEVSYTVETNYVEEAQIISTNWYGKLEGKWTAVPFRPFLHSAAGFAPVIPKNETNPEGTTNVFALAVKQPAQESEKMIAFYRIVVPLDINGPVRFRIRRVSHDALYTADKSSFILLDNIIASVPADGADLETAGYFAKDKIGSQVLGWELMTSVPYPSVSDKEIKGSAVPIYHVNSGDPATADTSGYFSSATMHYRWRYLNQTTNQEVSAWKAVDLDPHNGFKAVSPFELPAGRVGDVEYWFESKLQAPYYSYVDYSSVGVIKPSDYTEERGVRTNKLDGVTVPTGGDNWFFRLREGKSDYSGLDIVFKRGDSAAEEPVHMALVGDHVWRGFVQTKEDQAGEISYRIEALDEQTAEFAEYAASTNYWYCKTDNPRFPVSDSLVPGGESGWSKLTLDAVTGYVMFQIDDTDKTSMSLTIVHADYQNANGWSDAHGRSGRDKDGNVVSPVFVGTSTTNAYKVGVSPSKQTFSEAFSTWGSMAATNNSWTFPVGLTDIKSHHMEGRTAYEPFKIDQNGLWDVGPGMWVAKQYRDDRDNAGVALQMAGNGNGYFQFTDKDSAPRGLESISFNARLTQDIEFDDVAYYFGGSEGMLGLSNYTFVARTAFDLNANRNFKGNASLSVFANYLPNKGAYEARWEWLGNDSDPDRGQRLCLYRWKLVKGQKVPELIVAVTNTAFDVEKVTAFENSSTQRFSPLFISVSNDVPNKCTWVAAGIRRCGVQLGQSPIGTDAASTADGRNANWLGVCFKDTDSTYRLTRGTYGVLSANCPGVFARPEFSQTVQFVALGTGAKNNRDTFANSSLAQVNNLTDAINCAERDLQDSDYPGWNIVPERNAVEWTSSTPSYGAVVGAAPAQDLHIYLGTAGRGDWGKKPYTTITVDGFGGSPTNILLYTTKDCSMRFAVGDGISDIAVDTVVLKQWRGGNWDDSNVWPLLPAWADDQHRDSAVGHTNFVFTSAWVTNHTVLLSAKRAGLDMPSAVRSPLMDGFADNGTGGSGYIRGIGLGMISIAYENAQENACLELQIATNNVDHNTIDDYDKSFSDKIWTKVATYDFNEEPLKSRRNSGILNTYLGLHDVKGAMRVVVSTNAIDKVKDITDTSKFGDITITAIVCSDEPPVDVHSWWGWNIRTIGDDKDSEKRMFLNDYSTTAGGAGLSLAINNSVDENYDVSMIDVSDRESYIQHKPFVQTPTFTSNIVGEVVFKARKYSENDPTATVTLYGSSNAKETDEGKWERIDGAVFMVSNAWYETYRAKMDPKYKSFRLAVAGVTNIVDASGGGNELPAGAHYPPPRVLLDEIFVSEAVNAIMGFRNVGCFRKKLSETTERPDVPSPDEQPICQESWGVQCEIYGAQLASDIAFDITPKVKLHWYEGVDPWGYDNWKDRPGAHSALLSRATGTDEDRFVYRSSMRQSPDAVVPMSLTAPTYVQYTLEVVFYTKENPTVPSTNWLSSAEWKIPEWYRPLDLNATLGKGKSFSAYNIIDNVSPGWAWINEVNIFGSFKNWTNTDDDCQYVEIAHPPESDISGWTVRFLEAQQGNGIVLTNVLVKFGPGGPSGKKDISDQDTAANMVFRVIANEATRASGKVEAAGGEVDAVWKVDNPTQVFTSDGVISYYDPVVFQLVRTSGIIEHEIIVEGTNFLESLEIESPGYLGEMRDWMAEKMPDSDIVMAGYDFGGPANSLSVTQHFGRCGMAVAPDDWNNPTNDWKCGVKMTPGHLNDGQYINPDHPVPAGEDVLVYLTVKGDHITQSLDGVIFTNGMFTAVVNKESLSGTNVIYRVDPWYVLDNVRTGSVSLVDQVQQTKATQPFEYTLSGVAKGVSNNVTVVASAALNPKFGSDWGVPEDDPYRDAIIDWLEGGTDLYGNPFEDVASGEIRLAKFRNLSGAFVTNLTLREMYWLDMDPTIGDLALIGGVKEPPTTTNIVTWTSTTGTLVLTNLRMGVYMMITNENETIVPPQHKRGVNADAGGTHWTPYVIRGREPGASSVDYNPSVDTWDAVTFKVVGMLMNGETSFNNITNKVPLRFFVFNEESFGADGMSRIEVVDPYSPLSLGYQAGWKRWWDANQMCPVGLYWSIDTRRPSRDVRLLKKENYYGD